MLKSVVGFVLRCEQRTQMCCYPSELDTVACNIITAFGFIQNLQNKSVQHSTISDLLHSSKLLQKCSICFGCQQTYHIEVGRGHFNLTWVS